MKKLSLVLAVVFAASMAMAQHTEVVNQTGDNNLATVNQSFSGSGTALDGNQAFIDQIGDRNKADVDQVNNGYGGQQHVAKVWSKGDDNNGKVFQDLEGMGNALVNQIGNENTADIHQVGNFAAGAPLAPDYDAIASQEGDKNIIKIDIYATNSTAYAFQYGDLNEITQTLGSAVGEKVENSNFSAKQYGDENKATQIMDGQGWAGGITALWNNGWIMQAGNKNIAVQEMKEDGSMAAQNNYANADQRGNENESYQTQTGQVNYVSHMQNGNLNNATTTQTGTFNTTYVVQN